MPQEEANFHRLPLACCQISELNCSKAPLDRWLSTTILSNICLIAAPILAPNLPISGNTAKYSAAGSSIKNPVFMRVCGHFEARRTTRYDPNVITPKAGVGGSNPFWRASQVRKPFVVFRACFYLTELDKNNVSSNFLCSFSNDFLSVRVSFLSNARCKGIPAIS